MHFLGGLEKENMIRIYGLRHHLKPLTQQLSDVINDCMVEGLQFPDNKRAHRFFFLEEDEFFYPEGRTSAYTILEISMMSGRSKETKKQFIHLLFSKIQSSLNISNTDLEITLLESPPCNWGFRGVTGDEATLDYSIQI